MKKIRVILHLVLIASMITGIVGFVNLVTDDSNYITQEEAEREVTESFYDEATTILGYVGRVAEFNDKYGDDEQEVKDTDGLKVGELKKEYNLNNNVIAQYQDMLYNMFYYNEEDVYLYDDNDEDYMNADEILKYGYSSKEEYKKDRAKYEALIQFLYDYEQIKGIEEQIQYVSNFEYVVKYTDQNGNLVNYASSNGDEILKDNNKYQSYFLYDKLNSTSLMNNLKQEYEYESLIYKCKTFTDYKDFYAVFAINSDYPYNDIYSYYANDVITDKNEIARHNSFIALLIGSVAVGIMVLVSLMVLTGRNGEAPLKLYLIDHLWWDVAGAGIVTLFCAVILGMDATGVILRIRTQKEYMYMGIYGFAVIEIGVIYLLSIVRRFKAKCFIRTSFLGVVFLSILKLVKKLWGNMKETMKALICAVCVFIYMLILSIMFIGVDDRDEFCILMWFLLAVVFLGVVFWVIWKFNCEYHSIAEETRNIANGDITNKIRIPIRFKQNNMMAEAVNSIGEGINKAVDENVKNERMKTDLITNVSHDIKTPLTSIINYVNLLKMENIEDKKVANYIRILDEKSQRLKSLTDDLVEASKLSSGVIELHMDKLNLVELIKQSAGEYEEKFNEKYLDVIMNLPNAPVYVMADGRKMWRVLENLYGNIYKYALKGTRVYVDLVTLNGKIILFVKNISNSPLNFESEELTERFIRGDVSRSTEGSGLGLSIAKSIIDRHNGEFKIILDGDLFKVMIKLDEYYENESTSVENQVESDTNV